MIKGQKRLIYKVGLVILGLLFLVSMSALSACGKSKDDVTATPTEIGTATQTPLPTFTSTPTSSPTMTQTAVPTPTPAPTTKPIPSIALSQTSSGVGRLIYISGNNFTRNVAITITFENRPVASGQSDNFGEFISTFTVPAFTPGSYTIVVSNYPDTHIETTFTVLPPSITLNTTSGLGGSSLTVVGVNFEPGSTITEFVQLAQVGTVMSDSNGNFVSTFTLPFFPPGSYTVMTMGGGGSATATYVVTQ